MVTSWNALKGCIKCQPDSKRFCYDGEVIIECNQPFISRENVKCRLHRCNHLPPDTVQKAPLIVSDICVSSAAHISGAPSMSPWSPNKLMRQRHFYPAPPQWIYLYLVAALLGLLSFLIFIVLKLFVFDSTSVRCKNITTIKTSDIKLRTQFQNSRNGGWIRRTAKHLAKQKC